ncbi:hypothetical protein BH09PSE3_BH09PSE3_27250 [soil metagenome]
MTSDMRFYSRRAAEETAAAARAVTEAARQRRLHLAATYAQKVQELRA